jgi:hypothetical protein
MLVRGEEIRELQEFIWNRENYLPRLRKWPTADGPKEDGRLGGPCSGRQ